MSPAPPGTTRPPLTVRIVEAADWSTAQPRGQLSPSGPASSSLRAGRSRLLSPRHLCAVAGRSIPPAGPPFEHLGVDVEIAPDHRIAREALIDPRSTPA